MALGFHQIHALGIHQENEENRKNNSEPKRTKLVLYKTLHYLLSFAQKFGKIKIVAYFRQSSYKIQLKYFSVNILANQNQRNIIQNSITQNSNSMSYLLNVT